MGFQHLPEVVRKAAFRKGGKVRGKKGFAANPELAKSAGSKGGIAKRENRNKGIVPKQEDSSGDTPFMEAVLSTLDE